MKAVLAPANDLSDCENRPVACVGNRSVARSLKDLKLLVGQMLQYLFMRPIEPRVEEFARVACERRESTAEGKVSAISDGFTLGGPNLTTGVTSPFGD
jgi:hypothetical protein